MYYYLDEVIVMLLVLTALFVGRKSWATSKKALFPKLVAAGLGCIVLKYLHHLVYYMVKEQAATTTQVSSIGSISFFMFLISASYGQLDRLFDERSRSTLKYRIIALAAPAVLIAMALPVIFSDNVLAKDKIVFIIGCLPVFFASYFNFKHSILPDRNFNFVKAIRPYNITALMLEFLEIMYLTMTVREKNISSGFLSILCAIASIFLMIYAKKGAEKWKT